jgi:hypothetical protein
MTSAANKSTATAAEPYSSLLSELRQLKAQGADGFEGYVRDLLGSLSGRTLRLMKSGPQSGKDVLSDTEYSALGIAIEAKRFGDKTELSLDMQKSKLRDALADTLNLDVRGIAASLEIKEPDC